MKGKKRGEIIHLTKGTIGGLDLITSEVSNSIGGKNLLLTDNDPFNLYHTKIFIGSYKLGPEILFPKITNLFLFLKLLIKGKIIHVHITNLIIFLLFPLFLGKKVIFSVHKNFGEGYEILYKNYFKKNLFKIVRITSLVLYLNYINFISSKIILLSNSQKENFRKYLLFKKRYDFKTLIIKNFILSKNILKNKKKIKNLKISFVGRLSIYKGVHDLIHLIEVLPKDIEYNIVGDGKLSEKISKRKNINHLKNIAPKDLNSFYDKSNVLILPSYSETCGLVLLEAMSRGLVILASDLPAIREYFKEGRNGYLFPPGDLAKMEELILFLKNNPQEIERMSQNNLKDIHNFTSEKQVPKYMAAYVGFLKKTN